MVRMMPVRVMKAYIFAEMGTPDGGFMRMLYELRDSELEFSQEDPQFDPFIMFVNLDHLETTITLEGKMVQGKLWTGKFPGEEQAELEPERKELTDG